MYDEKALEVFGTVTQALSAGDIDRLETLAATINGFPLGGDPCFQDSWFMRAIGAGCSARVIDWMMDQGCDPAFVSETMSWPIQTACWAEPFNPDVAQALLDRGAGIDQADELGCTALHIAALGGRSDVVTWLLAQGANPWAVQTDDWGRDPYPLDLVNRDAHPEIADALAAAMDARD